ncbi:MAG: hypothetical protein WA354_14400 [Terracidiphilus sp.]
MIETLYKTKTPEKERSECYVLVLASRPASEDRAYVFMEEHGRWDAEADRFIHEVKTLDTEGRLTHEEGLAMFNAAKKKLAERGFIYGFVQNYSRKMRHVHQLSQPEAVIA